MVSDYLQKSSGTCRYSYSKLKDVLYLVSSEHLKDVQIDNGEAYISGLTELPLRINGFNIQFNEETSLDERYKFKKTLTLSMHGYVNYKIFGGRYYAIIEDVEGTFYMVNVDFPSRITHTFNLSKDTNQTDFTFSSLSNFPTLKLNAEFEAVSPVCLGLNVYGIDKLELIEFEKARLDTVNKTVVSTEDFKKIEFMGNSCSFQEVYDGMKATDTITFDIALDNYKPSWQYNLLEFLDNRYAAIITPKGNDNKYYPGYNFGLQPSYTINTASQQGNSDIITITLVEMSSQGSTAAVDWQDEQSTATRWRWVKKVGEIICYECIGFGKARYLVKQEVDIFGNPTGNYQVMEGYESQYPTFHIVGTFTTEQIFDTTECTDGESCQIETTIPNTIMFNAVTCNTYTLKTSCDWKFNSIPSNIAVSPTSGLANTLYNVSICNTTTPTTTAIENSMILNCCKSTRIINLKAGLDSCIRPLIQYINCLSQDVTFVFDGTCRLEITSIDPKLTYAIGNNTLTIRVPRNYTTSSITWSIVAINCNCSSESITFYINQDKTYERWVVQDGFICEDGNSYHVERRYTGVTQNNINTLTDETRKGSLIQSGDTRCNTSQTKWEWDGISYYCVDGNKFKAVFEWISYDGGINWIKTGNTRLGDMVEADSEWCNLPVTYSWVLTSKYTCSGNTSYYLYQKYEQRGEQDPIPAYPNYWSIDGDGTQQLNKKMDNDPECGYVPPSDPIYRWSNIDISVDYVCDDCPPEEVQYRTIESGYTCVGYDRYRLNLYQVSYDYGQTWTTLSSSTGNLVEKNSVYCGYVPGMYRWVDSGEFVCLSGDSLEIVYEWIEDISETICDGYVKRRLRKKYYRMPNNSHWVDTGERMLGEVIETFSTDCEPTYTDERWYSTGNRICSGGTLYEISLKQIKVDGNWIYKYPFVYNFTNTGIQGHDCFKIESTTVGWANNNNTCGLNPGEYSSANTMLECDGKFELTKDDVLDSKSSCVSVGEVFDGYHTLYDEGTIVSTTIGGCIGAINSWFGVPDVYLSDGLTVIYNGVEFEGDYMYKLKYNGGVYVKESTEGLKNVIIITDNSIRYENDTPSSAVMGNKVEIIGMYSCGSYAKDLVMPSTVKFISAYAFSASPDYNTSGVTGNLDMSACTNLKRIEVGAFRWNHITNIVFPSNLEIIDNYAFYRNESLSSVTIPNKVKYIGDDAFGLCSDLTEIVIPASVEYIGNMAFYTNYVVIGLDKWDDYFRTVYIYAEEPPETPSINGSMLFGEIYNITNPYSPTIEHKLRIYVPQNSVDKYKEAYCWKTLKNVIYGI